MTKTGVLTFLGVVIIFGIAFGAFQFGKIFTERKIPTVDERLKYLEEHQTLKTKYDRTAYITEFAKSRRPPLRLSSALAGNCEPLLDSAEHYLTKAEELFAKYGVKEQFLANGSQEDRGVVNYYTLISVMMADSYDDCLGNP